MSNLVCLTQYENPKYYKFALTNIKVYSFEEALYHCYHYWKQSIDEFLSDSFVLWVKRDLKLDYIAERISEIRAGDKLSECYIKFLSVIDYFSDQEINRLRTELILWEKRLVWERLKEQADSLVQLGECEKAVNIYKNALKLNTNPEIYNNLGIAYNKMGEHKKASEVLNFAYQMSNSQDIIFNLAEARILNGEFDIAESLINQIEKQENQYYILGLFNLEKNKLETARDYFLKAYALNKDDFYLFKISEVCVLQKYFDDALRNLNMIKMKNEDFYLKEAEVFFLKNNINESIRILNEAVEKRSNLELWIALAKYNRLNNNYEAARIAIERARAIDPLSIKVEFENANIKKSQGKIKDFQSALHNILEFLKKKYRSNNEF